MKGRSSRLASSDHNPQSNNDDWVNGSWTVDCPCGVNFDDGEEMVDCDVCGVWVHTRCSGYDKGEKMFTCDTCRSNRKEETEVAQLLVELPTKTVRIESMAGAGTSGKRLWTDIPMEERVHVQGVPGGDTGLFSGVSKVFSPQLWKSCGYIPKKFNFRYREFPCWDDDEDDDEGDGAGALFSLAKESVLVSEETRKLDVGKERSLCRADVVQLGKKKKDDLGAMARKKGAAGEKEADTGRIRAQLSPTVFAPTNDAKHVKFCEEGGSKVFKADTQGGNNLKLRDSAVGEPGKALVVDRMDEKVKNSSAVNKHCQDGVSFDKSRPSLGDAPGKGPSDYQATTLGSFAEPVISVLEGDRKDVNDVGCRENLINNPEKTPEEGIAGTASEVNCSKVMQDVYKDIVAGSMDPRIRVKTGSDDKFGAGLHIQSSTTSEEKNKGSTLDHVPENNKVTDAYASCSQSTDLKQVKVSRNSEAGTDYHTDKHYVLTSNSHKLKQDISGSVSPVVVPKISVKIPNSLANSAALPIQKKPLPSAAKSSSSSSTNVISRSSTSDISKPADTQNPSPITSEQVISKFNVSDKKTSPSELVRGEEIQGVSGRIANSSENSTINVKCTSKVSQTYVSKRNISAAKKDSVNQSSSKASRHNAAVTSGSSDSSGSLRNQNETNLGNKTSNSVLLQRGEMIDQSETRPSSNPNQGFTHPPAAASNTPAALSDEELALLLHQELNSSPRVPRVPRVRHGASLPHLASSTATSIVVKRTSSSGGKDHNSFSRKRNKDLKDGSRKSRDVDNEVKRAKRLIPPSPDQRRHGKETLTRRDDDGSSAGGHAVKNSIRSSSNTANRGPSSSPEANDYNSSTVHNTSRKKLDNDSGTVTVPIYRTLPGLISEIMSKGKLMTLEELCDAVLPHWRNLRKQNGDRYAYSTPSQAVLDCLRNRNEWAQLVDRGPKTSSSRKRRMLDTEESEEEENDDDEDVEYMKDKTGKELDGRSLVSQREDFPKGKRKARRRRRLALQGRGIRDVRKKQKTEVLSDDDDDDDDGGLPNSSEDSRFNEYDSRGSDGAQPVGSEGSTSSD